MGVSYETISFGGWKTCQQISNGIIRLIAATEIGPRIVFFGADKGENLLYLDEDDAGLVGGDEYRFYGGHRLWHAPESMPRTYAPDNALVQVEHTSQGLTFTPPSEDSTGIQKQISIVMAEDTGHVQIIHRLKNVGLWPVALAPWALTMFRAGAIGIAPLPGPGDHASNLQPKSSIALWAYTRMDDPRWEWGSRVVMLKHDPAMSSPQKVGLFVDAGWAACAVGNDLLVKECPVFPDAPYPDRDSNVELFANDAFLEVETLGPITKLQPDETIEHIETWHFISDTPTVATEADVITHVLPHIQELVQRG